MNWIFLTFLASVSVGALRTWRKHRPSDDGRTKRTSVPGYSVTPGSEFALDTELDLERGADWKVETIEEFHSRNRSRIVLRFDVSSSVPTDQLRDLASDIARQVIRKTRARVVFAELSSNDTARAHYMFAPDGHGWAGDDVPREIFVPTDEH